MKLADSLFQGGFGLEKESLRVDLKGYLSHTEHPFLGNPYIDRDFCENQVEMITDPCNSVDEAYKELEIIHTQTIKSLYTLESGSEILWPFSNPPYVKGENDIPIANFEGSLKGKEYYRQYLAKKYGKKKMLFSGIHVNYSFSNEYLNEQFENSEFDTLQDFKNDIYLRLAKKVVKYSWLIVYLTAASPILDGSFFVDELIGEMIYKNLGSARCSEIGYWNDFIPILDYSSIDKYTKSIQEYVDQGLLKETSELYYPVRLKPKGVNTLENLTEKGVNHIELRMLDLNPFSMINVFKEDLDFIHLLILYLTLLEDEDFDAIKQTQAIRNEKEAAKFDDTKMNIEDGLDLINIRTLTLKILDDIERVFSDYHDIIEYQRNKIVNHQRYVERIKREFSENYVPLGIKKAKEYAEKICKGG